MSASKSSGTRQSWFDTESETPLIDEYVRKMGSYLEAMADGQITADELAAQEKRLIAAMREVEPLLDDQTHAKVTHLLCELAAYDLMHVSHNLHTARPATRFRG
ncbi:MAG TPA: hypothetical protein VFE24_06030 [Pirellulales bacterium]|jgi:hypothetical protein|nr:hypothetical protein [Pirellulales bacterium]